MSYLQRSSARQRRLFGTHKGAVHNRAIKLLRCEVCDDSGEEMGLPCSACPSGFSHPDHSPVWMGEPPAFALRRIRGIVRKVLGAVPPLERCWVVVSNRGCFSHVGWSSRDEAEWLTRADADAIAAKFTDGDKLLAAMDPERGRFYGDCIVVPA